MLRRLNGWPPITNNAEPGSLALAKAWTWARLDDLNEAAHRAIMRIYAGMGERNRALRQYEVCAQVLKSELGIEPQPETTALLERIRTGNFESGARPAETPLAESKTGSSQRLPVLTTPFIGRRPEIEQVKEFVLSPKTRLLTLFGPGGSGKTRLSIQAAAEIGDRFKDGVWFVPLATVQSAGEIVPAMARALNFSFHQEEDAPSQQLLDYLREKQLLMILDNFDQLAGPEAASLLINILTAAGAVQLIVTSRVRLNIQAEQVFPVPGMRMPTQGEAASWVDPETQAKPFSAMQLFLERARRIQPDFKLDHAHAASVAEICQLVSGMPLGLELAATWLELLPPEEIAAEIRRSLDFLATDQPDVPERQRSIRAVFDYSWKLLNEIERETFLNLSVITGSFTREAAQNISEASLRTLLSLANKSWLLQAEDGRYQLHPMLQHYGLEKLQQEALSWRNIRDRHAAYYAGFVADLSRRMRSTDQLAALEEFTQEINTNIKAAWDWLVAEKRWKVIREQLLPGLNQFGMMRWHSDEIISWVRKARLALTPALNREEQLTLVMVGIIEIYFEENWGYKENRPEVRLEALWKLAVDENLADELGFWFVVLGKMYTTRNPEPQAEAMLDAVIARLREQGDPWLFGAALLIRSILWGQFPGYQLSQNLQEALLIFRKLGTTYEQAIILQLMASNAMAKNKPIEEVVDLYQQAQEYFSKMNDQFGMGSIYWDLASLYFHRGYADKGFKSYQEMRRIFEGLGNQLMVAESLSWESLWATRYSTFEHAIETRQRSIELHRKYGTQTHYCWNIFELGETYRVFGYPQRAREFFDEARAQFEKINLVLGLGYYQRAIGDLAMQEGRYADARHHYAAYSSLTEQDNHLWSMAQAYAKEAWAAAHLGDVDYSRGNIFRCLDVLQEADETGVTLLALLCEACCRAEEGKFEAAAALAAFVAAHRLSWKENHDLAEVLLADLSEHLTDGELRAASKQLEGRDLGELTSEWLADYEAGGFAAS